MIKEYRAYSDKDFGWLQVSKKQLSKMGLSDKISALSREDEKYVYLESDVDADIFLNAIGKDSVEIDEDYKEISPIRKLTHYKGGLQ